MSSTHATLTIVLHHEKPSLYAKFEEHLKQEKWTKRIRMTWSAAFEAGLSSDDAIRITKADVRAAAKVGQVKSLDALVQIGNSKATSFSYP
jgi:hypothetical protein